MDIELLRRDTPGAERAIHFNNAGAALAPSLVLDGMLGYLRDEALDGAYETASRRRAELDRFYSSAARLLNCQTSEVAFAESATRAWDMAFYSLKFQPGDRILTSESEYGSNYIALLQAAKRTGIELVVVPSDASGQICLDSMRSLIDDRVKLIAITHMPTNSGLVNPVAEVGKIARSAGITYLLDACQSIGQTPLDVEEIGCDILTATGRKFLRGPRGTGLLYMREALCWRTEPVFLDMFAADWVDRERYAVRDDARRFEAYEYSHAGKIGLTAAIDYALQVGLEEILERVRRLSSATRDGLREIRRVTVRDIGVEQSAIVTLTVEGCSPAEIYDTLIGNGVHTWTCPIQGARLDMERRGLEAVVRVSPHYYNTLDEVQLFLNKLEEILSGP